MSIYYRDKNGTRQVVAGMTPGGDLAYGATTTRTGTFTMTGSANNWFTGTITFSDPMPDTNYLIEIELADTTNTDPSTIMIGNKTINGFTVRGWQGAASGTSLTGSYTAYKLYTVSEAEQNASDITTIKSYIPATTSSSNKLVNQTDLSDVEIDKLEDINDVDLTNVQNGQTILWDNTNSKWVNGPAGKTYTAGDGIDIDANDKISADTDFVPLTFVGTTAQWNALTAAQKAKYTLVNLTDDKEALGVDAVDAITNGDMRPVTSNAVYDNTASSFETLADGVVIGRCGKIRTLTVVNATSLPTLSASDAPAIFLRGLGNINYAAAFVIINIGTNGQISVTDYKYEAAAISSGVNFIITYLTR